MHERWIFVGNLFPVYSYLACCTVQCFLVRFFFCFDRRLVSLPYVVCKLSVALHSMIYTIEDNVPLLFRVDVEMTCFLRSLHLTFYACDVWNNTWVEHNWKAIFLFDFFPGSQLFWRVVRSNASLGDIFFCFDVRLVSLPRVLCKLSVALHSFIHTIVKHVPPLFGLDVEMTCSLRSLHLTFYACNVWE